MREGDRRPRGARGRTLVSAALVVAALVGCLVAVYVVASARHLGPFGEQDLPANPFLARSQYVDPDSHAAQAAAQAKADGADTEARIFAEIAAVPAGIWLTPEQYPPGQVGPYVAGVVAAADAADRVPLFVVYGIPNRDCTGGYSSGGLTRPSYLVWVREIAAAVATSPVSAVVLEPDALVSSLQCRHRDERLTLLSRAIGVLAKARVTAYIDAGHADWVPARRTAQLLRSVGVGRIRGFATNVANYQSDADETAYASTIDDVLGGDLHWVIDRGRNGNGATPVWCNPSGRALGDKPGYVADGTGLDAYLWIKPPGESDGECHGGPPAGEFWPERALQLARAAGW